MIYKKIITVLTALCISTANVPEISAAEYVDYSQELTILKSLLDECDVRNIPTGYETVSYKTIERFEGYINEDIDSYPGSNKDEMLAYNISCMDELYNEAKESLEGYLNGTKVPFNVTATDMGSLSATGAYMSDNRGPAFSIGYGHSSYLWDDIPNFNDFGANNIQMEVGPRHVYRKKGWNKFVKNDPVCTYEIDNTVKYDGTSSAKIIFSSEKEDDHYILLHQTVEVVPGKTYVLKGMVKASNLKYAFMSVNTWSRDCQFAQGTYDWKEYSHEYTVPANVNNVVVRLFVDGPCDSVYFDGFTFCEKGTTDNLLFNGSFDDFETVEYEFDHSSGGLSNLKRVLTEAAENNIGVSVLLSPHYMLDNLPNDAYSANAYGFINYNINHPDVLEVLEDYLNNLLPYLKDYSSLKSICLTNEPLFKTTDFYWFYNSKFQNYLKTVHGDIATLNKRYAASYPSFSFVYMPTDCLNSRDALSYDWMMFNDKVLADWHNWMVGIVKKHLPEVPVHNKMMGYFRNSDEEETELRWLSYGTDLELLGESSDWAGNDTWDYIDEPNRYYESMFLYDYQMSVLDKPVYNSEDHIIYDGDPKFDYNQRMHLRNNLWMGAAHGRSMSTIWLWERSYDKSSMSYNSILFRPDAVAEVGKTNLDLARLRYEMNKIQQAQPKVALFYSKSTRLYNSNYLKTLFNTYKEILNCGQKVGVVSDRSIDKLREYDVVVMPDVRYGTDKAYDALCDFDGKVIYSGELLSSDEYKNNRDNSALISKAYSFENGRLVEYFSSFGLQEITVADENGNEVQGLDWSYIVDNDKILVNITNLDGGTQKNISLYQNGRKLTNVSDLITGKEEEGITLNGYEPKLLEIYIDESVDADIASVTLNEADGKIIWTYTDDSHKGAKVYKISPNGITGLVGIESGTEFKYSSTGTYIVRAVSRTGQESDGKIITVAERMPFTIKIDSVNNNDKCVSGVVSVTNNNEAYASGVIVLRVINNSGEVDNYFYDYLTMPANRKETIKFSLTARSEVSCVEAYVCSDLMSNKLYSEFLTVNLQ